MAELAEVLCSKTVNKPGLIPHMLEKIKTLGQNNVFIIVVFAGRHDSVEWTSGMEWWNGILE